MPDSRTRSRLQGFLVVPGFNGPTRMASTIDPARIGSAPGGTLINALAPTREANRDDACGPVVDACQISFGVDATMAR